MKRLFVVLIGLAAMAGFATGSAQAGGELKGAGSKSVVAECGGFGP